MKAIRFHHNGGPEVLSYEDIVIPEFSEREVLVKLKASGVNFIDIYQREGLYPIPLPVTAGLEGAGIVTAIGREVTEVKIGDNVAYTGCLGSYAEYAVVPSWRLVKVPSSVDLSIAAAVMLQGMTAHYLTHSTYVVKAGDVCLVHAAAGGVGLLLIQMIKSLGAYVIGTVSTEQKAEVAKLVGADEIILYNKQDFESEVKRLTVNKGVNVVYDAVGKTTFDSSINCLIPRGYLVLYGQSSGKVPPIDPLLLTKKGSICLARPSLEHHTLSREEIIPRADTIFDWVSEGKLSVRIHKKLPLSEAAEAQQLLANRDTMGKLLLIQ